MTINNEQEYITIEFNNGDQQRYSKPAFAPSVKTHFTKLGYSFN